VFLPQIKKAMSSSSSASPKKLLRRHILAVSKRVCKEQPAFRQEQSITLCEKLFQLIENSKKSSSPAECFIPNSSPKSIGLYLPLFFEIDVEPLIRKLLQQDSNSAIKVFVPELYQTGTIDNLKMNMRFVQILSNQDLDENFKPSPPWYIREPPRKEDDPFCNERIRLESNNSNNIDLLIVPGVAFDSERNRLGKGGGYYDRWISAGRGAKSEQGSKRTLLVGVGFDEQLPKTNKDGPSSSSSSSSWWQDLKDNDGETPLELNSVPMEIWDQALDRIMTPKRNIF
jgi:5,10-methenyltetrahydrofolate synthetase